MSEVNVVAIITPKPGRVEEIGQALNNLAAQVQSHEPDAVMYQLFKTDGKDEFVFIEKWKDEAALENHRQQAHYQALGPSVKELVEGPPDIKIIKPYGGFAVRSHN